MELLKVAVYLCAHNLIFYPRGAMKNILYVVGLITISFAGVMYAQEQVAALRENTPLIGHVQLSYHALDIDNGHPIEDVVVQQGVQCLRFTHGNHYKTGMTLVSSALAFVLLYYLFNSTGQLII
jgi:hypothetical protein